MDEQKHSIGRKSSGKADILLDDQTVSSLHAYFKFSGGNFSIQDISSTNGTFVQRGGSKERVVTKELRPGDIIYFGKYKLSLDELISLANKPVAEVKNEAKKQELRSESRPTGAKQPRKKQKCIECGMVITAGEQCPYCGNI
jgi:pSer/pThr/pTyr-binding forkhead associated (FHA) protein